MGVCVCVGVHRHSIAIDWKSFVLTQHEKKKLHKQSATTHTSSSRQTHTDCELAQWVVGRTTTERKQHNIPFGLIHCICWCCVAAVTTAPATRALSQNNQSLTTIFLYIYSFHYAKLMSKQIQIVLTSFCSTFHTQTDKNKYTRDVNPCVVAQQHRQNKAPALCFAAAEMTRVLAACANFARK